MILITSDFHLGYGYNTEREKDCYFVLDDILREQIDLILFSGDMFESRIPRLEVLAQAIDFLTKLREKESKIKFISCDKEINVRALQGIPFISIYGNHERRPNLINPIQTLERAGLLINLHCQKIIFELEEKKIAIHGMSHVPERYARDVLFEWNPKPVENAINILLMHQNVDPFIYSPLEDVNLKLSDLPKGFDYIINGHVHWRNVVDLNGSKLIIPGSTVATQLNKKDSEIKKGYFLLDKELEFKEIKQRKFYYKSLENKDELENFLENLETEELKPIIKIKIKNTSPIDLNIIEKKYRDKGILIFQREIETKFEKHRSEILAKQLTAEEYGQKLLKERMKFDKIDDLINAILEDDFSGVEKILRENFSQVK
jgi:DNA repair exonuclease SbcCD nuclease subunit